MKRMIVCTVGLGLLLAATGPVIATAVRRNGPPFVTARLDIQIVRDGRYFEARASRSGQTSKIAVDGQTGRLRADDDHDD
jgi:hypothetical protein